MRRFALALDVFRELDHDMARQLGRKPGVNPVFMPFQHVCIFVYVALHPDCTTDDIMRANNYTQMSTSRGLKALGDQSWIKSKDDGKPRKGYGLVDYRADPANPKRYLWFLTPRGRQVADKIIDIVTM
jgi:DNA-binding MarR family transcriptional regulator